MNLTWEKGLYNSNLFATWKGRTASIIRLKSFAGYPTTKKFYRGSYAGESLGVFSSIENAKAGVAEALALREGPF